MAPLWPLTFSSGERHRALWAPLFKINHATQNTWQTKKICLSITAFAKKTRNTKFLIPYSKSKDHKNSSFPRAVRLWNELTTVITDAPFVLAFASCLKICYALCCHTGRFFKTTFTNFLKCSWPATLLCMYVSIDFWQYILYYPPQAETWKRWTIWTRSCWRTLWQVNYLDTIVLKDAVACVLSGHDRVEGRYSRCTIWTRSCWRTL